MAGTVRIVVYGLVEVAHERVNKSRHLFIASQAILKATLKHTHFCERSEVRVNGKMTYLFEQCLHLVNSALFTSTRFLHARDLLMLELSAFH